MRLRGLVRGWAERYKTNGSSLPEVRTLEGELYSMSGIERHEPSSIVLIPIGSPDLHCVGSVCGVVGNRVFSSKSLVSFLSNRNVREILGIIGNPEDDETYQAQAVPLNSIALPIFGRNGHMFEHFVSKGNGSFRYERSRVLGWSVYESE